MNDPGRFQHPLEPLPEVPKLPAAVWERLTEWRKQWSEIWYVRIGEEHYVYRAPTRDDCIQHDLNSGTMPARAVDTFVQSCLLYPEVLPDDLDFTVMEGLYNVIWETSGARDPAEFENKLAVFDNLVRSPGQENLLLILKAFPGLLPDEVNSWQHEKIIYHVALARTLLGLEPMKPPEMSDEEKKRARAQARAEAQSQAQSGGFDWSQDLQEWQAFERS